MKLLFMVAAIVVAYVSAQQKEAEQDYAKEATYNGPTYDKPAQGYFQYANVPGPYEYEFGYNRGNKDHSRSHYEQSKDHKFRTRVKWNDAYSGYGEHYWEYNHGDYSAPAYSPPAYSPPATYEAPKY